MKVFTASERDMILSFPLIKVGIVASAITYSPFILILAEKAV
jgi:hypothetical protein